MIDKNEEEKVDHTKENLEAVGQMILGELEIIAGTITADGITRAEGEYNTQAGSLHQEANKNLTAVDEEEEAENEEK
jgi:hypothetical protein